MLPNLEIIVLHYPLMFTEKNLDIIYNLPSLKNINFMFDMLNEARKFNTERYPNAKFFVNIVGEKEILPSRDQNGEIQFKDPSFQIVNGNYVNRNAGNLKACNYYFAYYLKKLNELKKGKDIDIPTYEMKKVAYDYAVKKMQEDVYKLPKFSQEEIDDLEFSMSLTFLSRDQIFNLLGSEAATALKTNYYNGLLQPENIKRCFL